MEAQQAALLGKALQEMLGSAFSFDNFGTFLCNLLKTVTASPLLGKSGRAAAVFRQRGGSPASSYFHGCTKADRKALLAGRRPAVKPGCFFPADITHGNLKAGTLSVATRARPANPYAAAALVRMAARLLSGRYRNERRDIELNLERDISDSINHIEEFYLSFPGISIKQISRAVLDEARRLTGSSFGLAGYVDTASGDLVTAALTREAASGCPPKGVPVIFTRKKGLPGWILRNKKPLMTNRAETDRRAGEMLPGHACIKRFLGTPAMSGRRMLGMLAVANPAEDFTQRDLRAMQRLARIYAMIIQRKAAEEKQKEKDTRFQAIIDSSRDAIYTVDLSGKVTYVSPRARDYGYAPGEVTGRNVLELAHPDDRDFLSKALANAAKTGQTLPVLPYRLRRKDGSYAYVAQKSGIVFRDGKPAYITGVLRDITDQHEILEKLRSSEGLLSMVFETAKDAIFIKDMNGLYIKANKACAELLCTDPLSIVDHSDYDYFPKATAEVIYRTDSEVVRKGKTLYLNNFHPFPSGSRYVHIIKTPLKNTRGETVGLLGIARDITDIKNLESKLALRQAAEAVSEVARPMAHDFNNALAAINGYATLIDDDLKPDSPIKKEISRIIEAVKRAAELTSRFQDFARNPEIKKPGKAGDKDKPKD